MKPVIVSALLSFALYGQPLEQRFQALMRDILIFDAHIDTPCYVVDAGYRMEQEYAYYETDIPRLKRGRPAAGAMDGGASGRLHGFCHALGPREVGWRRFCGGRSGVFCD